ncbi:MAG TPA: hypothetical protein VNV66_14500 [Pilimelia sp.]|nr:hypothetical protein [Pilimelia sp.]
MNQILKETFDGVRFGRGGGLADVGRQRGELVGGRACGGGLEQLGELVESFAELVGLLAVVGDAGDGVVLGEAVLDGGDEPVGAGVECGEFSVDAGGFVLVGRAHGVHSGGHGGDGLVDEVGALVGVQEGVEDGLFDLIGG